MRKEIRCWLIILLLQLTWIPLYICGPGTEQEPPVEVIEEEDHLIRWKQDDMYEEESMDVSVEPLELDETQTATGAVATEGRTVAVDPTVIPYGTVLIINGHEYVAEDCGAWIQGNDIDIYFESHEEADKFGVQYMEVFTWE